jgi:hypothetical protein
LCAQALLFKFIVVYEPIVGQVLLVDHIYCIFCVAANHAPLSVIVTVHQFVADNSVMVTDGFIVSYIIVSFTVILFELFLN